MFYFNDHFVIDIVYLCQRTRIRITKKKGRSCSLLEMITPFYSYNNSLALLSWIMLLHYIFGNIFVVAVHDDAVVVVVVVVVVVSAVPNIYEKVHSPDPAFFLCLKKI